jgi:hypothetical protein
MVGISDEISGGHSSGSPRQSEQDAADDATPIKIGELSIRNATIGNASEKGRPIGRALDSEHAERRAKTR